MHKTITDDYKNAFLASSIVEREHEVFHYQINIDNYTHLLTTLPTGPWPAELVPYMMVPADQMHNAVPPDLIENVLLYQHRDRISHLVITERAEQSKAKAVYDALLVQLQQSTDTSVQLVQDAAAKRDAKTQR